MKQRKSSRRRLGWILLIAGSIGALAALALLLDRLTLLENPDATLACDVNPFISCGEVMLTDQAAVFGFPNPIVGVLTFPVVVTIGAALLAGAQLRRWFWQGLQLGVIFGMGFVLWLYYQTAFVIQVLCPYCIVVWVAMWPIFWYVTLYNLDSGYLGGQLAKSSTVRWLRRHHADVLVAVYLGLTLLLVYQLRAPLGLG